MTSASAKLLFLACGFLFIAETHAQAFNIDFGRDPSTPSSLYGAASGQAGFWNIGNFGDLSPLSTLDGSLTPATLSGSSSGGGLGLVVPNASPDEQTFMGDFDGFSRNAGGYVIQRLRPGTYDVFVYSWRGFNDQGTPGIVISAPGGPYGLSIASGQPWPGQQVLGVTYGVVRIDLGANGTFGISGFAGGEGTAPINGIQIVPVPAPGAAILGPLAGLAFTRRRRGGADRERSAVA